MSTTASSEPKRELRLGQGARPVSSALLLLASTLFALLVCELGLRWLERRAASSRLSEVSIRADSLDYAVRYVTRLAAARGTDRHWFVEDPAPYPNRSAVSTPRLERFEDFKERGIFAAQADYLWNSYYLEQERCAVNGIFQNYPDLVLAFAPPGETFHPRYRFPPNITTALGLVTNQFGFRGHPLELSKPAKTIRIAFVGASTTVGNHGFPFSYPDYVEAWLNRYAQANNLDVHFEAINAGREGLTSEDIAAIVQDELLPLDPDLVVYYEGSNQFRAVKMLASWPGPPPSETQAAVEHKIPEFLRKQLAIADLADRALSGFGALPEPRKPAYRVNWPSGVDQRNPDVNSPNLPLNLPRIVNDLDAIRNSIGSIGGQLVLCSFEWLAKDGMGLQPTRHQYIYRQLNTELWPLRYSDVRQMADFQNRVFRRYAASRGVPFLDVAAALPQDPNLFVDAIHMTQAGDRLRAWITFQKLAPVVRAQIESRRLPHSSAAQKLPPPPSLAAQEMSTHCPVKPTGPLERIANALALDTIDLAYAGASIDYGSLVKVTTAPQIGSYAASIQINAPLGLARPCYLYLRARVTKGKIGVGTLDHETNEIQLEKTVTPTPAIREIYVPVLFPDHTDALLIRNLAADGTPSEVLIEDAALLAFLKPQPEQLVQVIPLSKVRAADPRARLEPAEGGFLVTAPPGEGSYGARVPLGLDSSTANRLSVHVFLRTLEGKIGAGILTRDEKAVFEEHRVRPLSRTLEMILPLPSPSLAGDLMIRNAATGKQISKAILERVEVRRAP